MKLSDLLDEAAVVTDLEGLDKWGAIERLVEALESAGRLSSDERPAALEAVLARERTMSTGMQHGIAIPHAPSNSVAVSRTAVALGIAPAGIEFQAIDGKPTHLIMLLITAGGETRAHIRTLAEIARLLSSEELRAALIEADSPSRALEVIRTAEQAVA